MSENIFLSESITDTDIETWYLQDVLISADTGYGKTHFIKTKLYEYAKKRKQNIAFFNNYSYKNILDKEKKLRKDVRKYPELKEYRKGGNRQIINCQCGLRLVILNWEQ